MSYWTYTDIFYEAGPPPSPFHGGFGLMNIDGVRKPAWFAYKYLHALRGSEVPVTDDQAIVTAQPGRVAAIVWNWTQPKQDVSDRPFYTKVYASSDSRPTRLAFKQLKPGAYTLTVRRTGFRHNDAQTAYLEMGSPEKLSPMQLAKLQRLTRDLPEMQRIVRVMQSGGYAISLPMRTNDVVLVELERKQ
jgi:xylan 1,4-beta-xylosidase